MAPFQIKINRFVNPTEIITHRGNGFKLSLSLGINILLAENTSQAASVRIVRLRRTIRARSRLRKFVGKARKGFFDSLKSTDASRWICYYIKGYSPYSGTGDSQYSHRMRQSGPGAWPGARRRGGRTSPGRNRSPAPGPGAQKPAGSSGSRSGPGEPPL